MIFFAINAIFSSDDIPCSECPHRVELGLQDEISTVCPKMVFFRLDSLLRSYRKTVHIAFAKRLVIWYLLHGRATGGWSMMGWKMGRTRYEQRGLPYVDAKALDSEHFKCLIATWWALCDKAESHVTIGDASEVCGWLLYFNILLETIGTPRYVQSTCLGD